jgi:hypothetical protein
VVTASVDTWSGLLANQFCPDFVETRRFVNITDPSAVQWLASPQGQPFAAQLGLPDEVQAAPTAQCSTSTQLPNIRIVNPTDGQQVQGLVQITGAAQAPNFNRYQIEFAPSTDPENFRIIANGGPFTTQQPTGGTLATWDTTQVPNGIYRLRLAAFANDGGYAYRIVQVGVNNPLPTATPQPTLAPTLIVPPTVDFGATPLPFDTPSSPGAQLAPTTDPAAAPPPAGAPTLELPPI